MSGFAALFADGRAADVVLAAMAIEFAVLVRGGRPIVSVAGALLPGALLVLALRLAMTGADWRWIALALALSLPLHLADLVARGWLTLMSIRRTLLSGRARGWRGS